MNRHVSTRIVAWATTLTAAATAMGQVNIYHSSFEGTDGGWTATGDWQRGIPTNAHSGCDSTNPGGGPAGAFDGSEAWGTGLTTCYANADARSILSQTFDLSGAINPMLRFWQVVEVNGAFDFIEVYANGDLLYSYTGTARIDPYQEVMLNLAAYQGLAAVNISFELFASGVVNDPGWFIDDVRITSDVTPIAGDLQILAFEDTPDPVGDIGEPITYNVHVFNADPTNAVTDVVVTTNLDAATTFNTSTTGSHAGGVHTANFASIAPLTGESFSITVLTTALGDVTASASATGIGAVADPDTANNMASATTNVALLADLVVSVDDLPDPVIFAGEPITYTITVQNNGPADANNVEFAFNLDPRTTFDSATSGLVHAAGAVTGNLGTIADGASAVLTITALAGSGSALYIADAGVVGDETDPTPGDAMATIDTRSSLTPPNDDCFGAISVASFPFTDTQDTSLATGDGPAAATCNTGSATTLHNSVWYHINVAVPQVITVTISDVDNYDLIASVWEGTCGTIADLPVVCGDEPEPVSMQFVAAAGQDYMLGVGDWGSTAGVGGLTDILIEASPVVAGACCLNDGRCVDGVDEIECTQMFGVFSGGVTCAEVSCSVISANDYCENPATISEGVSASGTTFAATGTDLATCGLDELDVWYAFTPAANMGYVIDVTGNTTAISIAVYEGCGTVNLSCDAGTVTTPPSAEFTADCVGTPVLIRVATNETDTSDFNIVVNPLFGTPLNDRCCAAEPIMLGEIKFGDVGAAAAHDDVIDPCGFDERDVWYVFTPPAANTTYQAVIDPTTTMSVTAFDGCPETGGVSFDCGSSSLRADAVFVSDAFASPVLIRVGADSSASLAGFDLQIFEDDDTCVDATVIMSVPFSETVFDMENNFPDPDISCNSTVGSVLNNGTWWLFEGTGEDVRLTMRDNGITSTFDEVFAVYEVPTGTDCATLTEFDEMVGGCSDAPEFIFDFHAQLGMSYYFLAGNWSSSLLTDSGNEVFVSLESADNADVAVGLRTGTTVAVGIGLAGDPVKYYLDLTNNGPAAASNVPWSVTLPDDVAYGFSDDGVHDGSPVGGVVSGTLSFLDIGGTAQIIIVTDTVAFGVGDSATASSPGGTPVDVVLDNNTATSAPFLVVENADAYGQLVLSDDLIDGNYGPEPKSIAPDLGGRLIAGFDKPFISPDGTKYILNVDLVDPTADDETLVVFDGVAHSTVVQEGFTLMPDLSDLVGLIDQKVAINDSGEYVFQTNTDGTSGSDEVIVKGLGASHTVIAREGNIFPDGGSLIYGAEMESPNVTNAGGVYFWHDTNPGSVTTTSTDEYVVITTDDGATVTHVLQEGVFVPGNQVNGGTAVLGDIDSNDFWATGDGAHYLLIGDLDGGTTNDDVVIYDGNVVIQENVLVHPDLGDSADSGTAVDAIFLAHNGDWYARGSNNNDTHWVVKNGEPIAVSGQPIYPGATENWDLSGTTSTTATFFFVVGDRKGNYVVGGFTDAADETRDVVLVLNGERVISRERDPIDLDGNGFFDDSPFGTGGAVFINSYGNDDGIITDDGKLLVTTTVRSIVTAPTSNSGDVFISIDLGLEPACPCETDGADGVDVFDLLAYLDLWFVNDAGADLDGAAGVDVFDLLFFLDCWFPASAGAPC